MSLKTQVQLAFFSRTDREMNATGMISKKLLQFMVQWITLCATPFVDL